MGSHVPSSPPKFWGGCSAPPAPQQRERVLVCPAPWQRGQALLAQLSSALLAFLLLSPVPVGEIWGNQFEKHGKPKLRGRGSRSPAPSLCQGCSPQPLPVQLLQSSWGTQQDPLPWAWAVQLLVAKIPGWEPVTEQSLCCPEQRAEHGSDNITPFPVFHSKFCMQRNSILTQLALKVQFPPRTGTKSCPALLGTQISWFTAWNSKVDFWLAGGLWSQFAQCYFPCTAAPATVPVTHPESQVFPQGI